MQNFMNLSLLENCKNIAKRKFLKFHSSFKKALIKLCFKIVLNIYQKLYVLTVFPLLNLYLLLEHIHQKPNVIELTISYKDVLYIRTHTSFEGGQNYLSYMSASTMI